MASFAVVCVAVLLVVGAGVAGAGAVFGGSADASPTADVQEQDEQPGEVSIQNLSAPEQVRAGENFTVSANVTNEGTEAVVRRMSYRIAGSVIDSELVELPASNTTTVVFNVTENTTSALPNGTFTHGVFTEDAEATANLTVVAAEETTPEETTPEETTPEETTPEETTPEETTPEEETTPAETTPEETTPAETTPEETTPEETTPEETTPEAETASLTFEDQTSNGSAVTVQSVTVPEGGFVVVHDTGIIEGEVAESVLGHSDYLEAGTQENVTVELDEPLNESQRLVAVVYRDSNDNQTFDFVTSNRTEDGPYTREDSRQAVNAIAEIELEEETGNETDDGTA